MILFFGTRPGKTVIKSLNRIPCSHCGQSNTLSVVTTPNYFHLFWIKLFKISTNTFAECSHCKRVFPKEEFSEEIQGTFDQS